MEYIKLEVWLEARKLTSKVFNLSQIFPKKEIYDLTSQIRRCAISVPSNIAEGCGRQSAKETVQFLYIARGSAYELETQIYLSLAQKYLSENDVELILNQIQTCKKLINGFIKYNKTLIK